MILQFAIKAGVTLSEPKSQRASVFASPAADSFPLAAQASLLVAPVFHFRGFHTIMNVSPSEINVSLPLTASTEADNLHHLKMTDHPTPVMV